MRFFTPDDGDLIELKPRPATVTVYKHTWRVRSDGYQWVSYHLARRKGDEYDELLTVEEIEGVVLEAAE